MTPASTPRDPSSASGLTASRFPTSGLAASRRAAACGREGLEAVFRRAAAEGKAGDCDSIEAWMEAIIAGEAEDLIEQGGWRPCRVPRRCLRAARCLQPRRRA